MTDEPEHPEPPGPDDDGRSRRRAGVPTIAPSEPETVGPPPREAARGSERRRRRRRNGLTLAVVVALVLAPLLRGGRMVRVAARPARRRGRPGRASRSNRAGGAARPATRSPATAWSARRSRSSCGRSVSGVELPGGERTSCARTWACERRADALEAGPASALAGQRTLLLPPGLTLSRRSPTGSARCRGTRATRSSAVAESGVGALEVPAGRRRVARGAHLARHLLRRRAPDRRGDPADDRERVRRARRRRRPRRRAGASGSRRTRRSSSASLIQGEASADDAADVSGVIVNRLRQRHPAADRRHPLLREGWVPAGADQRRQADRLAVQHLPRARAAADADPDRHRRRRCERR